MFWEQLADGVKVVPIGDGPPGSHLLRPPSAFMEFYLEIIEL